jgi:hypothetical protein
MASEPSAVCAGNIGVRERRKRAIIGWLSFGLAIVAFGLLVAFQVARAWRLAVFVPLWFAFLAWLEARTST